VWPPTPPLSGSNYLPLPGEALKDKKAILNIQNEDNTCFLWSALAAKHPVHRRDQPHRVTHYQRYKAELNMEGIDYPVIITQLENIERQNEGLSVNVSTM
jgi:hypothetical protein